MLVVPGAGGDLGRDGEWSRPDRLRIIIREVVNQLLYADGIFRRKLSIVEETPGVTVRSRININGEGRKRRTSDFEKRILIQMAVRLRIARVSFSLLRHG